ncbi:cytochrome P450 [Pseudonocardia ailaonensis]|uniref:Cytochrome P450 n=1 Tax=Pseudonocardia ailaonensis TaxID=367279 RepID=A0ABN2N8A4_9PSEU
MTADAFTLDLFADGFADDPYPHYAALRAAAPVHEHPLGFWLVSRHADVVAVQRGPHSVDERNLGALPSWKRDSGSIGRENRMLRGLAMLDQDPPNHTRLRRLVTAAFTRRAVGELEARITDLVDAALDRIADKGRADVVDELAFPLPFTVISELLGIPVAEQQRIRALTGVLALGLEPLPDPALQARVLEAGRELTALVGDLARWKRGHPGPDLFSALIEAEDHGDVLDEDELVAQVAFLYVAGHETTMNQIAGGLVALLRHPGQLRRLRADPALAGTAVEELLRYDTPVHLMRRITLAPLRIGDAEIPAGAWVVACLAAANRDPAFWGPDADELRLDRPDAHRAVSFGAGAHHCLGAALARVEARIAFSRFARRFADAELEEVRWNGRINVRGPASAIVRVG